MDENAHDGRQTQSVESLATQYELQNTSELLNYLDVEPEFRQLAADLAGKKWDDKLGKFVDDPVAKPLCNVEGIKAIIRTLRAYFSKSATINDFDDKKINKLMRQYRLFIKSLFIYPSITKKYDIDVDNRHQIVEILTTFPYINLHRSLDGHELSAMTKVVRSEEKVAQTYQAKEKWNPFKVNLFRRR